MKTLKLTYRTDTHNAGYFVDQPSDQSGEYVRAETARALASILQRITEKVTRANALQYSGCKVHPVDWSELYDLQQEAFILLRKIECDL